MNFYTYTSNNNLATLSHKKAGSFMDNILIVDDQQEIRLLLVEVFKRESLSTFLAASG